MDPQRRSALLATKLGALVREHLGAEAEPSAVLPGVFPGGAALARPGAGDVWVMAEEDPERSLGGALAWARQQGQAQVHLLVDDEAAAGVLARRAGLFAAPAPKVWLVVGRSLRPVAPAPFVAAPPLSPAVVALAELIRAGGADPVVEHGVLVGEVDGLEVCRVVEVDGVAHLEVGVGRHDREAFALMHGDVPPAAALVGVASKVRALRGADEPHPLRRMAVERRLRNRLVEHPEWVGAEVLVPIPPPVPTSGLRPATPAVAAGTDPDGGAVVAVCSVGVDLDLVPWAADARLADGRDPARLVLVVPQRDVHPVTVALAARLAEPAEVVGVDWA